MSAILSRPALIQVKDFAAIWTSAEFLSIGLLETIVNEILIETLTFHWRNVLENVSVQWRLLCFDLNMLTSEHSQEYRSSGYIN